MAFLPIIALAASAAVGAVGAIQSSKMQSASYKSAAAAARYNTQASMQNATAAQQAASANEMALRRQNDQRMGAMRAQAAESGGGFTGTNLEVLDQSATNMELDALNTRYRGKAQAAGLLSQANLDAFQSRADQLNAGQASQAGYIGAASQALGAFSNYYNYRNLNYGYGYGGG